MPDDNFGDWRIAMVTTLAEDQPAAYPGGPSHRAGTPVYISNILQHKALGNLGFVSPHPTALALSVAIRHSRSAIEMSKGLSYKDSVTPWGGGKLIPDSDLPLLYDFFEHNMIVVAFSFQAIEAFANSVISRHPNRKIKIKRKKGIVEIDSSDAERNLSTEEKLAKVLPILLGIPNPSGKKIWGKFKKLKDVRDTTIHFKSEDMFTKHKVDTDSLYYHFFDTNPLAFVSTAYEVIKYFLIPQDYPRWFIEFQNIHGKELSL